MTTRKRADLSMRVRSHLLHSDLLPHRPPHIQIEEGDLISFTYFPSHNVVLLPDEAAYAACDSSEGVYEDDIPTVFPGSTFELDSSVRNLTIDGLEAGNTYYFVCSIGAHCFAGQKIPVTVVSASPAPEPEPAPEN